MNSIVSPVTGQFETVADFNLVNRLLQNPRYKIPEHLRDKVLNCCERVIDKASASNLEKLSACKTVLMADKHNLELVKMAMPKKIEHFDASKATDEELIDVLREVARKIPPTIDCGYDGNPIQNDS